MTGRNCPDRSTSFDLDFNPQSSRKFRDGDVRLRLGCMWYYSEIPLITRRW
jgi:hypothetical protein